ncbi:MAG TPA: SusC/RagA family TonB-linked outer membrane protein [Gemmatimonadaceae bacterium]|nr:SusC/RagA family TonB-linked outer membrane protein [Gemmatimonadaceae bacterium]
MQSIRLLARSAVALLLFAVPATLVARGSGSVTGEVKQAGTGRPLVGARVTVVGTSIAVPTGENGAYTIRSLPAGRSEIRVFYIGHESQKQTVNIGSGQTARTDFTLQVVPVQLSEIVTTATGDQRRLEVGSDIARVNAAQLTESQPIKNIADLLTARAPGVQVTPGAITGTQSRVRIRGTNSLSLNNDPIYIIDGIRMESASGSSSIGIGGAIPSRVGDIDPEQIESIEIVKGPSAATLYGTDAANGVVVITTKRGRTGKAKWNTYVERGRLTDKNKYPTAYTLVGKTPGATAQRQCILSQVSAKTCVVDSLRAFNLFEDPETTPLTNGTRAQYGAQVSGGSEALRYFLSGEWEEETGVYTVPRFDVDRLTNTQGAIRPEHMRPNALERVNVRGNINLGLNEKMDVAVSTGFVASTQRLPQTDNNTTGLLSSAYGGPGFRDNGNTSLGFPLNGYRIFTPGDVFQDNVNQEVNRFIGSVSPTWRPFTWLSTRGNFGIDYTNRVDSELCRRGNCSDFGTSREGFRVNNRTNFFQYTFDVNGTGTFNITPSLNSKTTAGVQYFRNVFSRNGASGSNLPPGAVTVTSGAVRSAAEATAYAITAGAFVEQTIAVRDRLFLTGALRADNNTAFGQNFDAVYYPKASVSWILSEEEFFPRPRILDQFRLRAAYGASGVSPGTNDALLFFSPNTANLTDQGVAGITFNAVGNPELKPERAVEFEGGVDIAMFDNRLSLELTGYRKKTKDALIQRILPGSLGITASRFENIGSVQNNGFETGIRAQILRGDMLGFDVGFNHSINENKILTLQLNAEGKPLPIIVGTQIQHRVGFPLFGYYQRPLRSFEDKNSDGFITVDEVVIGDTAEFLGRSLPRTEMSFTPGIDLFNQKIRLTASIDRKAGYVLLNANERIRCQSRNNCSGLSNPSASLFEQARVVALRDHSSGTQAGFVEDADYTKLREMALTFATPMSWGVGRAFRAERISITLAARNLKTWTNYSGIDPESAYFEGGGGNDIQTDFQTAPPPRYYTLRVNLGF